MFLNTRSLSNLLVFFFEIYLHSTTPDQLTIKSSDDRLSAEENTNVLNVSHSIRAVTVGRLNPSLARDVIVVGTPTHVLAYDVEANAELFYKEVGVLFASRGCSPVDFISALSVFAKNAKNFAGFTYIWDARIHLIFK